MTNSQQIAPLRNIVTWQDCATRVTNSEPAQFVAPQINQSISDLYDGAIIRREGGESEAPG